MFGETLYNLWAPPASIFSPWAKPALFAQIKAPPPDARQDTEWQTMDASFAPPPADRTALVIDLPGEVPLLLGIALAHRGYQPVVLYNCCDGYLPVIDLRQCIVTLCSAQQELANLSLPADAPPAFLLDSRRRQGERHPAPGTFNNRWVTLPQDFPSGNFLQANNIRRALVIQNHAGQPADDLAHVLLRWQQSGMQLSAAMLGGASQPLTVKKPTSFRYAWYALLATIGLRANDAGGFGARVPVPQSTG